MASPRNSRSRNIDIVTFSVFLALVAIGWLMVYAVNYDEAADPAFTSFLSSATGKQTIWTAISLVVFVVIQLIDWRFWQTFAYLIYGLGIAMLLAVLVFGVTINGANSWLSIGGFTIQPSEFAKFGTALALAAFLNHYGTNLKKLNSQLSAVALFIAPVLLILLQPDAGSALVFFSFLILLYREGLPGNYYILGISILLLLLLGFLLPLSTVILGLELLFILLLSFYMPQRNIYVISAIVYAAIMTSMATQGLTLYLLIPTTLILLVILYRLQSNPHFKFSSLVF